MNARDPLRDAFEARSTSAAQHVDVDRGLSDVQRRAAIGGQIRQGAMAAVVLVALVAGGFALANRGDGSGSELEVAGGDDPTTTTAIPTTTVADTTIAAPNTTIGTPPEQDENAAGTTTTGPASATPTSVGDNATTTAPAPPSSAAPGATTEPSTDGSTTTVTSSTTTADPTSTTAAAPTTTASTTSTTTGPTTTLAPSFGTEITVSQPLWRVVNVDHNDELNVRAEPIPSAALVGSLAPAAMEVSATGRGVELSSGATWFEIQLGNGTIGWVNSAFLSPMNGGTSFNALPCLLAPGANLGVPSAPFVAPSNGSASTQVVSIGRFQGPCDRVVLTLDDDGFGSGTVGYSSDLGVRVDLPQVEFTLQGQNASGLTYVIRDASTNELYVERLIPGGPVVVTYLTEPARIVIDRLAADADIDMLDFSSDGVIVWDSLTKGAPDDPATLDQPATIRGIARPFEAQMGVGITNTSGTPVSATWSGGINGTTTATTYGVMTSDWTSAWGEFEFSFTGLAPGDYVLVIEEESGIGVDNHEIPFTVEP